MILVLVSWSRVLNASWDCSVLPDHVHCSWSTLLSPLLEKYSFLALISLSIDHFFSTFPHDPKLLFSTCRKRSLSLAAPQVPWWILKELSLNTAHGVSLLLWRKSGRNGSFSLPPTPQIPTPASPVLHQWLSICWIFHVWLLPHLTTRPGTCFSSTAFLTVDQSWESLGWEVSYSGDYCSPQ